MTELTELGGVMRKTFLTFATLLGLGIAATAGGDLNDEYFAALGNYHNVSYEEVFSFADEVGVNDVAAAYAIAGKGKISIDKVVELRTSGESWSEVARDCGLSSVDFYILISGKHESKTFSPIFEKFSAAPTSSWGDLVFSDEEIVSLTNLRFMTSHHDYSMFDVMAMKDVGSDWPRINQKITNIKAELKKKYVKR